MYYLKSLIKNKHTTMRHNEPIIPPKHDLATFKNQSGETEFKLVPVGKGNTTISPNRKSIVIAYLSNPLVKMVHRKQGSTKISAVFNNGRTKDIL